MKTENFTHLKSRRKKLMDLTGPESVIILPAAPIAQRNGDYDYPYRQQSDFYYFTGFNEPQAVAVFLPNRKEGEFVLFNRASHRDEEMWEGTRAGQKGACDLFGADESFPIELFSEKLPALLEGRERIHYAFGMNIKFDASLLEILTKMHHRIRQGSQPPFTFIDVILSAHEMRLIKETDEIDLMRKAARISALAHRKAMQLCKPGMNEFELEAAINYECQRHGARFQAYTPIVGSGIHTCTLHYNQNNKKIEKNDLVLIDAGCEYQNYASDITRTFPASGRFSPEQKAIYEIVLEAQLKTIELIKPGVIYSAIHEKAVDIITQGLIDLKILKGDKANLIEQKAYHAFYMHNTGHWLGLDVHDVGRYKVNGQWRTLQPGMVMTVEPGLYISPEQNVETRWHNIGIRIEDDILVTSSGYENLSHDAPKTISDIENLVGTL